jgi:Tripartite tricarboxylate transporter TctB family
VQVRTRQGRGERIFAALIGAVFVLQFALALRYPADPRLFPLIVSAIGAALALAVVLGFGLGGEAHGAEEEVPATVEAGTRRAPFLLALTAPPAYGAALWLFGYWIATPVTIPVVAWLLGYRRVAVIAAVTSGVTLAIGILFPLVHVPLPAGLIFARAAI